MAKEQSVLVKSYLFIYNVAQFMGWLFALTLSVLFLSENGSQYSKLWKRVEIPLTFFQTLQLIEVLHCVVRFVPSSPVTTFMQIFTRLFVVWGILLPVVEARASVGVALVVISWCTAEITRYLYYALNLINSAPYVLTWCRYSFFTFLYPSGVSGEIILMYTALPYISKRHLFSYSLPNFANISFHYNVAIVILMLLYIPFFPKLYFYMIGQRRKVLGSDVAKKTK